MKEIMESSGQKPTAVVVVTDRLAIGAMQHLKELGLDIPGDMAVVGMGASELSKFITPSLSTIDFMIEEAGKEAAGLLLSMIDKYVNSSIKREVKHRFLQRDSI